MQWGNKQQQTQRIKQASLKYMAPELRQMCNANAMSKPLQRQSI
jgi:hypothetical protein